MDLCAGSRSLFTNKNKLFKWMGRSVVVSRSDGKRSIINGATSGEGEGKNSGRQVHGLVITSVFFLCPPPPPHCFRPCDQKTVIERAADKA
jgi:hypothetical protein